MPPEKKVPTAIEQEDDDLAPARATVVMVAGIACATTPALWLILTACAGFNGIELKLDERILVCCLGGLAAILAFGFKKKFL